MGMLVEGEWRDTWYDTKSTGGRFVRSEAQFRNPIEDRADARFRPEAGRYHLYVSLACPWAHRTLILRKLKGLEDAISVTVVDPYMGDEGWSFPEPDPVNGASYLREIYAKTKERYTGRVTVPVLWDTREGRIVNNESREIIRMFDHDFSAVAKRERDLCPEHLREQVDAEITALYEPVNNGVYRSGFATTQGAYEEAVHELFAALDAYDARLGKQRYLVGDQLTEADVCFFTTLVRFDAVYHYHFKCNVRRIRDYEHLWPYLRDIYQEPGVAETVSLDHIKQHYFRSHPTINPHGIVPVGPLLNFEEPHGRG